MDPRRSLPGSASASNGDCSTSPTSSGQYTDKPLPPLPRHPASLASSYCVEVNASFRPPRPTPVRDDDDDGDNDAYDDDDDDDAPFFFDWDVRGRSASAKSYAPTQTPQGSDRTRSRLSPKTVPRGSEVWTSVRWDQRRMLATNELAKPRERHTLPKVDLSRIIPSVPPDEILSPQPKQSVQKILRLTGYMSPMTTMSTDSPTLHNSSQKIRQLTGLDYGLRGPWTEDQLPWVELEDEISNVSTSETASTYSNESLEGDNLSTGHSESVFSSSHVGSVDEVYTQLTAPKYSAPPPAFRDSRSYSEPLVRDALRLSGFNATDSLARPLIERRESWFHEQDDSDTESLSVSSDEHSDVTELQDVMDKSYHQTAFSLVSTGSETTSNSGPALVGKSFASPPLRPQLRYKGESNLPDDMAFAGHRNDFSTSPDYFNEQPLERYQATNLSPPSPVPSDCISQHHFLPTSDEREPSPLSVPLSPLSPPAMNAEDDHWLPLRTFYSPGLITSLHQTEVSSARFSTLSRILTSDGPDSPASPTSNSIHNQRKAAQSGGGAVYLGGVSAGADDMQQSTSTWSPDTPDSEIATFAVTAPSIMRRATDAGITTSTTPTLPAITPATAGGGRRGAGSDGRTSSRSDQAGQESPKGLWKRALGHAKSRAGVRSKADKKRHK